MRSEEVQTIDRQIPVKRPRYTSLVDDLREEIATLDIGHMLPPERDLARQHLTGYTTMRKVLAALEEEGLLRTYHGRGRVVTDPLLQGEFAIVARPKLMRAKSSLFYRETAMLLSERVHGYSDAEWSAKLHLGQEVEDGYDFPATLNLMEPKVLTNLRGVFTFNPMYELIEPLRQRGIPIISFMGGTKYLRYADVAVRQNLDSFFNKSLHHLRDVGCKTVGLLAGCIIGGKRADYKKLFAEHAIEAGLSTQEKWMHGVPTEDIAERNGYECFMKIREQGNCPDAFVIDDDIAACGVFRAVLHKQIRVPEQIRLITFANKGVDLHYHKPVTRYELDIQEMVDIAFDAMVKLLKGWNPEQKTIYVPGKLIIGKTT